MAWLFVRLKLRLIAGGLRGPGRGGRIAGLVAALLTMLWVVPLGFLLLAAQHGRAGADNLIVLVYTAFAAGWLVLPLMTFGADETLDPARLALLPLRPRELAGGLLAAALTGFGPILTVVLLAGSMVAAARGAVAVLVGLAAVAIELTICVAASRALVTALSSLLRSRRGRDLGVAISGLLVLGIYAVTLTFQRAAMLRDGAAGLGAGLAGLARIARWAPPGVTANAVVQASAGRYGPAMLELGAGAVTAALALWLWLVLLHRALETADTSTQPGGRRRYRRALRPVSVAGWRAHPRLWSSRALTTAGRELRYYRRDPRRKQQLVSLAMPVFIVVADSVPGLRPGGAGVSAPGLPTWPAVFAGAIAGLFSGANQFGLDGSALWLTAAATSRWQDLRADIAGKNLAGAVITIPVFGLVYLALGLWLHAPGPAARAVAMIVCAFGATSGVASILSVLNPVPIPDRRANVFSSPGTGQGCLAGLITLVGLLAALVLLIPALVLTALWHAALPVGILILGYGALLGWAGRRAAAVIGFRRMPEILATVSRPV
ncbi:MAG: hypothetical protein ACYCU3_21655 [Streptosporangiaceae bacterium]